MVGKERRKVRRYIHIQVTRGRLQAFAHGVHRGPDHVLRPRLAELEPLAVAFDARERQEVLDQAAEAPVLARNQIEVVAGLLWIELFVFEERVPPAAAWKPAAS